MKIGKKIFISSILLLLTVTPSIASNDVMKNISTIPQYICDNNCLGNITLIHFPGLIHLIRIKGVQPEYTPPSDNPNFEYYFPENETGYVFLNFTLHVRHRSNDLPVYWAKLIWFDNHRYSMVKVWIHYGNYDYCIANKTIVCNKITWEYFDIPLLYNAPLYTNNQTLQCNLWVQIWAIYTPMPIIQLLCTRFLFQNLVNQSILIHPYKT